MANPWWILPPQTIQLIFIGSVCYTVLMIPITFIMTYLLISNKEAWICFKARFSRGKSLVLEGGDNGIVSFRIEKEVKMGALQGDTNLDYSFIPRSVATRMEEGEYLDADQIIEDMRKDAARVDRVLDEETIEGVMRQINAYNEGLKERSDEQLISDNFVNELNRYRHITESTKVPLFIRYSGKAIASSISVATGASYISKISEYLGVDPRNLKIAFTKMITPSQVMHVAFINQLIGAKKYGKGISMKYVFMALMLVILGVLAVYYLWPMFAGAKK